MYTFSWLDPFQGVSVVTEGDVGLFEIYVEALLIVQNRHEAETAPDALQQMGG